MCVTVEITLPTIQTFLLLFSLRVGCLIILFWTSFRSCFGVLFFTSAILEVLVHRKSPLGWWLVSPSKKNIVTGNIYILYYLYVALLVVEAILLLFTVVHFAWGLYQEKSRPLRQYLICRFLTWIVEVAVLLFLCLNHKLLIGWYLVLLLFVILEFYSLITVYSYYVNVTCEENDPQNYPEKLQKMYNFTPNSKSVENMRHTNTLLDGIYRS